MKLFKNDQRGLAGLQILLLVVIVAGLGGVGWYVYHASDKTKADLDKTAAVSASQPATKTTTTTTTKTTPTTTAKEFIFKEFGIKITQPDSLKDLTYTAKQTDYGDGVMSTSLFLNDSTLAKSIDACNTNKGSSGNFAAIAKSSGNFPAEQTPDTGSLLKQFTGFYISSSYPNGIPCADDSKEDAVVAQMQALQKALVEAFKTASLVQ